MTLVNLAQLSERFFETAVLPYTPEKRVAQQGRLADTQPFQCYCNDSFGLVVDIKRKQKYFPAQLVQDPRP